MGGFVDQFGNHFLRLGHFPSLFLSMALDVFNLRKARWEPSGSSVTLLWLVVPERKMFVVVWY